MAVDSQSAVLEAWRGPAGLLRTRQAGFWVLQFVGWSSYVLLQFGNRLLLSPEGLSAEELPGYLRVLAVAALSGVLVTTALRSVFRRLRHQPLSRGIPAVLVTIYVAAVAWRLVINLGGVLFENRVELLESPRMLIAGVMISTYVLLCWSALYFGIYWYERVQQERERTLRARSLAQEAQMKMLRYQLDPHFLFNTLNAVSTLVLDRDGDTANRCVTRLSAFLRHTLDQDPMKTVTLREELEALDLYVGIEQLRFGSRLRVRHDVARAALDVRLPSLILQPLVESALRHAVAPSEAGATVTIAARVADGRLRVHVADDGALDADARYGAAGGSNGLRNTRERLDVLYGGEARLATRDLRPGVRVELEIPVQTS